MHGKQEAVVEKQYMNLILLQNACGTGHLVPEGKYKIGASQLPLAGEWAPSPALEEVVGDVKKCEISPVSELEETVAGKVRPSPPHHLKYGN